MTTPFIQTLIKVAVMTLSLTSAVTAAHPAKIVYLTPDIHFSFWHHIAAGIATEASKNGFEFHALSSDNDGAIQLKNAQHAIAHGATGLVLTPTDSATAPAVLALAKQAHIPVVIADVGTNSGEYVSYISSDNYTGAYQTGQALMAALGQKGSTSGDIATITLSLARNNGRLRSAGFAQALKEAGAQVSDTREMTSYTADESHQLTKTFIAEHTALRGLFVQADIPTLGAVQAIKAANRSQSLALAAFDGTPEFIDLIKRGDIVVSGMQQPYLMGQRAGDALINHLAKKPVAHAIVIPILIVTNQNINELLPILRESVFANEVQ
jgi:ribose transport system substrate-binding protein